jgi:alkyldihydroxyacetonephosphate synthase
MTDRFVDSLIHSLGNDTVSTDPALLDARRHDYWVLAHLDDRQGRAAPRALCVVQPRHVDQVVECVQLCRAAGIPIVPHGLGSGVCGGVQAHPQRVLMDLSTLAQTRYIDAHNLLAAFDAGKRGSDAEQAVAAHGLTIGHWPQSIDVSSVGGWVATRASGQFSTANGNIEDIVYAVEAVLADGSIIEAGRAPRAAAGPDLRQLLLGSEGTLGIITGVTCALRRKAEAEDYSAYIVPSLHAGFEFQRAVVQSGWQPPVMRQYDAIEAHRSFAAYAQPEAGIVILVHEGPATRVAAEIAAVDALAAQHGLQRADAMAATGWLDHRNTVSHWDTFLDKQIIVDTAEISAPWDRIERIYDTVIAALKEVPDLLNASAHSSHVYRTGINLYFSFAVRPANAADMRARYVDCWRRIMTATAAGGGGIAHHHGIGRLRRDYLSHDLGDTGIATLRRVKQALDPAGIFNPGVLLPDA